MPQPTFLRSICTVPVTPGAHLDDQRLWARVFSGWRARPVRLPNGALTEEVERALRLVIGRDQPEARVGALVYATWPQSGKTLSALVNTLDGGRFITVRVFGEHLTEVQATAEAVTTRPVIEWERP
ncbi:hypothetical protein [Deinococcus sp. YIM 77859]|uniref:hypothetical protein n=1 Tax=Deinococcus sp. YIM 77859 TaxID=1540221 RepID=UPI000555ADC9|nr:hypothetical protein [Deinococcus sp. YIM 77859]